MKSIFLVCLCCVFVLGCFGYSGAAERDELAWKGRALVAEYQNAQKAFSQAQTELTTFLQELDKKGLVYKDGVIVEKPKPAKIPEPPKK
jgi:hypothetical protein